MYTQSVCEFQYRRNNIPSKPSPAKYTPSSTNSCNYSLLRNGIPLRRRSGRSLGSNIRLNHASAQIPAAGATKSHTLVIPPSTTISWPVTKPASSLAKNTTTFACSIASPNLPVGKCTSRRNRFALSSPSQFCSRGVLRGAGQRELKRKPSLAWTIASSRVRARTAPLDAV